MHFIPVPSNPITEGDSRLSDARPVINGSVTNLSVAGNAGIQQSKLNLNEIFRPFIYWESQ